VNVAGTGGDVKIGSGRDGEGAVDIGRVSGDGKQGEG
jgi:hypothetical protein